MTRQQIRIALDPDDTPKSYVNIVPYLRNPLPPPIDATTGEPVNPEALTRIFAKECVRQEVSQQRTIPIVDEVREAMIRFGRPTPLQRAHGLEEMLKTPARIYYKREDVSPTGSHKTNTALAQCYYAMKEGVERYTTETGAGQWGCALALACSHFGLDAMIYMVRVSYEQKAYRGTLMRLYGAKVVPSPSQNTEFGRRLNREQPGHPGSLGIAISEALEDALGSQNTKYSLGSVLNHVLLHQTVIGQEAKQQLNLIDTKPDYVVGCVGGGSNFAGLSYPFIADPRFKDTEFIAAESDACPKLTHGEYRYDFGDTAGLTPKLKMYTLGANFIPPKIHAGGLRYHGSAPTLSALIQEGRVRPLAYNQVDALNAGALFARTEGIVPAPESSHAIKAVVDLALEAKERGEERSILFNLSGHGHFDMTAYDSLMDGTLSGEGMAT